MTTTASRKKIALVTGATRGIGLATAQQLAEAGYRVVVTGRTARACDEAAAAIGHGAVGRPLDLSSFASIRAFAADLLAHEPAIDVLVNNAATMALDHDRRTSEDGLELTLATNVLGPFLLTHLLLERLRASAPARVVNVGSRVHLPGSGMGAEVHWDWDDPMLERTYEPVVAYKNSKLATMWFTDELARRLAGSGVTVHAVCPGFVPQTLAEHKSGIARFFYKHVMTHVPGAHTVPEAAANTVYAATSPDLATKSGLFIGEKQEVAASADATSPELAARFYAMAEELTGVATTR